MAQRLGKERADLENIVNTIDSLENSLTESLEFLKLAEEEDNDEETIAAVLDAVSYTHLTLPTKA